MVDVEDQFDIWCYNFKILLFESLTLFQFTVSY